MKHSLIILFTLLSFRSFSQQKEFRSIKDGRIWNEYIYDSLYLSMKLPDAPFIKESKFTFPDSKKIKSTIYSFNDTSYQTTYIVEAMKLPNTVLKLGNDSIYNLVVESLANNEGWKKVIDTYDRIAWVEAREVEFSTPEKTNSLYKVKVDQNNLYLASIKGDTSMVYSSLAIKFLFPVEANRSVDLEIELAAEDTETKKRLEKSFATISSDDTGDIKIMADSTGLILLTLPTQENEYKIKVSCNDYVSKTFSVNTKGLYKIGNSTTMVLDGGTVELIKRKKNVDYSIYDKIDVAKARMINDTTFDWDLEFISKMKDYLKNNFESPPKPSK